MQHIILKLMREFSKKKVYSGDPSNYKAWADAMWARGFNTSQEDVMNLLSVSRSDQMDHASRAI